MTDTLILVGCMGVIAGGFGVIGWILGFAHGIEEQRKRMGIKGPAS